MSVLDEAIILNNGSMMPKVGIDLDTFETNEKIDNSYRLYNCKLTKENKFKAVLATNQKDLQQIYLQAVLPKEIAVDEIENFVQQQLSDLQIRYFTILLLENRASEDENLAAYQKVEKLKESGRIKCIGLADFYLDDLQALLPKVTFKPVLNQLNTVDPKLAKILADQRICLEQNLILSDNKTIGEIGKKKNASSEQILLRYYLNQKRIIMLDANDSLEADKNEDFALTAKEAQVIEKALKN